MNYSEEEKKAIEIVKGITEDDLLNYWEGSEEPYNAIQIILNLIQKQEKIIDKMAEKLEEKSKSMTKGKWKEFFKKEVEKDVKN